MAEWAFVALGSNMGDRQAHLAEARRRVAGLSETEIVATSSVEETDPLGPVSQGDYLNQMVLLHTALSPRELLDALLGIEQTMGRVRAERWGPRIIDLDIVRFGTGEVDEPGLRIPHPELPNRDFWQREL